MNTLLQLIYASSATALFSDKDLSALLEKSRRYNAAHGLSGLLLYHEGNFLQVLEGPEAEVDQLETKIRHDRRHHHYLQLVRQSRAEREFPDWSMAFRDLAQPSTSPVEGFSHFLQKGNERPFHLQGGQAKALLLAFKKICNLAPGQPG